MSNVNLNRAQSLKNDEFYTLYKDVEKHVKVFKKEYYKDKIIYCPFDSEESNFVKYFKEHKDDLQYKELIYTCDDYKNHIDLFYKADIVISNPPFSKFNNEIFPFIYKIIEDPAAQLTAAQLTAAKSTAAKLIAFDMYNNFDLFVKCSNIYIHDFLTPEGEIKQVPATSIIMGGNEDILTPLKIEDPRKYTFNELINMNKIDYYTIDNYRQYISYYRALGKICEKKYSRFLHQKLPHFKNTKYFPTDFHGYALCPVTSILKMSTKECTDHGLFNEKYGAWKVISLANVLDDNENFQYLKCLIYHD